MKAKPKKKSKSFTVTFAARERREKAHRRKQALAKLRKGERVQVVAFVGEREEYVPVRPVRKGEKLLMTAHVLGFWRRRLVVAPYAGTCFRILGVAPRPIMEECADCGGSGETQQECCNHAYPVHTPRTYSLGSWRCHFPPENLNP